MSKRRVRCQRGMKILRKLGVKLALTTAYNPEANGKSERGHSPIVHTLVKTCNGKVFDWPKLWPCALWANRTTHNMVMGYQPAELMYVKKPVMPIEEMILKQIEFHREYHKTS